MVVSQLLFQSQLLPVPAILLILLAAAATHDDALAEQEQPPITLPGCPDKCGDTSIPFPFGIKPGCFLQEGFQLTCNHTFDPPRVFLASKMIWRKTVEDHYRVDSPGGQPIPSPPAISDPLQVELFNISAADSQARVYGAVASVCSINGVDALIRFQIIQSLDEGPFRLSGERNVVVGVGSDVEPSLGTNLKGNTTGQDFELTCTSSLKGDTEFATNGTCMGAGCCQATLPPQASLVNSFGVFMYPKSFARWQTNPCEYGMIAEKSWYTFSTADLVGYDVLLRRFPAGVPVVLDFAIGHGPCPADAACASGNSSCADAASGKGYACKCVEFYGGNPYIANGCQDVDECALPHLNNCSRGSTCKNRLGGYDCPCNSGLRGDGKQGPCTERFPFPAKITVYYLPGHYVASYVVATHSDGCQGVYDY